MHCVGMMIWDGKQFRKFISLYFIYSFIHLFISTCLMSIYHTSETVKSWGLRNERTQLHSQGVYGLVGEANLYNVFGRCFNCKMKVTQRR